MGTAVLEQPEVAEELEFAQPEHQSGAEGPIVLPRRWQWDAETYQAMSEAGFFGDKRVELFEGEIIDMSAAHSPRHVVGANKCADTLRRFFAIGHIVTGQSTMKANKKSRPEPDIAVFRGMWDDFKDQLPENPVLIVEASRDTLAYDRGGKAGLYASIGIQEYWILNLKAEQLEVYRTPQKMKEKPLEHGYSSLQILQKGDMVSPLALPSSQISVSDLLP